MKIANYQTFEITAVCQLLEHFNGENHNYLRREKSVKTIPCYNLNLSETDVIKLLGIQFLIYNIFVFLQIYFFYFNEAEVMQGFLSEEKLVRSFNLTLLYTDYVLLLNNSKLSDYVDRTSKQLKKNNIGTDSFYDKKKGE